MNTWASFSKETIEKSNGIHKGITSLETTKHGYLFRDAVSAFRKSLKQKNSKHSHFWLAELCISGEVRKAWSMICDASIKIIPYVCPNEMARLYRRMVRMVEKKKRNESADVTVLHILHDSLIILLWMKEQTALLQDVNTGCLSKVKVPLDSRSRRKAPMDALHPIVLGSLDLKRDPPNLIAASHEIVHAILRNDIESIRYWLSWLCLWTPNDAKSHERPHRCSKESHSKDWVWGLWDLIYALVQHLRLSASTKQRIRYAEAIFKHEYTSGSKKRKYPLLLFCFILCTNKGDSWKCKELPWLQERIEFGISIMDYYKTIMKSLPPPTLLPSRHP